MWKALDNLREQVCTLLSCQSLGYAWSYDVLNDFDVRLESKNAKSVTLLGFSLVEMHATLDFDLHLS